MSFDKVKMFLIYFLLLYFQILLSCSLPNSFFKMYCIYFDIFKGDLHMPVASLLAVSLLHFCLGKI